MCQAAMLGSTLFYGLYTVAAHGVFGRYYTLVMGGLQGDIVVGCHCLSRAAITDRTNFNSAAAYRVLYGA